MTRDELGAYIWWCDMLRRPEIYEIARKVNAVRIAVLLTNLAVLVYLIYKLWQEHRAGMGQGVGTEAES